MDKVKVEKKWKKQWRENQPYKFDRNNLENKHYVLEMFSYPSGFNLHLGHWYNYALSDSYARYKILKGYNVFQPMGFDAFGLPAENFAIKNGVHPDDSTRANVAVMTEQLHEIGGLFSWENMLNTSAPEYYKWTQWVFAELYKNKLAYRKKAPVNFCNSCNTVLANEQVIDGKCERCDHEVVKKDLTQWFFKITNYSEELLQGLDKLDWPEKTKLMQKNWIGKSVGGQLTFNVENSDKKIDVFTTRADTLFGCSYIVIAPEHHLVDELTTSENKSIVEKYCIDAKNTDEIERLSTAKEKTGVFTGSFAINPATNKKVKIFVADYVLATYGTGAVMGVPAHDSRDFKFAEKHGLEIVRVIEGVGDTDDSLPFVDDGVLVNSEKYSGLTSADARQKIVTDLSKIGLGELKTNYRLRDWLVSRQRYWGAPIPIIYCDTCGEILEENLPVLLPYDVEFTPDGKSPLSKHAGFKNCTCPKCGKPATRETDTLDTFVCSSWYFLRFPDSNNNKEAFNSDFINKMLPVDKYIGGYEHACMHLLYARFMTKALRDLGHLNFDEPFKSLVHQGIILGPDGNRMSKSRGNVISPDEYVAEYGSDVFRTFIAFGFKYIEGGPWSDEGVKAINKWIDRVERTVLNAFADYQTTVDFASAEKELNMVRHNTIASVDNDYNEFSFNTAVARMMELVNAMNKYELEKSKNQQLYQDTAKDLLIMLSPLAPHITQELWQQVGFSGNIIDAKYPVFDKTATVADTVELMVQFNSKPKHKIDVETSLNAKQIEEFVLSDAKILELLDGTTVKKVIVIPNRLVNIII